MSLRQGAANVFARRGIGITNKRVGLFNRGSGKNGRKLKPMMSDSGKASGRFLVTKVKPLETKVSERTGKSYSTQSVIGTVISVGKNADPDKNAMYEKVDDNCIKIKVEMKGGGKIGDSFPTESCYMHTGRSYHMTSFNPIGKDVKEGDIVIISGISMASLKEDMMPVVGVDGDPLPKVFSSSAEKEEDSKVADAYPNQGYGDYGYGAPVYSGEHSEYVQCPSDKFINFRSIVKDPTVKTEHDKVRMTLNCLRPNQGMIHYIPECTDPRFCLDMGYCVAPFIIEGERNKMEFTSLPSYGMDENGDTKFFYMGGPQKATRVDCLEIIFQVMQFADEKKRQGNVASVKFTVRNEELGAFGVSRIKVFQKIIKNNVFPFVSLFSVNMNDCERIEDNMQKSTKTLLRQLPEIPEDGEEEVKVEDDFVLFSYCRFFYVCLANYLRDQVRIQVPYSALGHFVNAKEDGSFANKPDESTTNWQNPMTKGPVVNLTEINGSLGNFPQEEWDFFILSTKNPIKREECYESLVNEDLWKAEGERFRRKGCMDQVFAVRKDFKGVADQYEEDAKLREENYLECLPVEERAAEKERIEKLKGAGLMDMSSDASQADQATPESPPRAGSTLGAKRSRDEGSDSESQSSEEKRAREEDDEIDYSALSSGEE